MATTYFGDVVTTGNTLISGTASFQGGFNYFNSNIVGPGSTIGSSATPFGSLYGTTGNIGTLTTSFVSNIGIGTTAAGNALSVRGNLFGPTSIGATNVLVTLANTSILNVNSISNFSASGTSLLVPGNVFASVGLGAGSIFVTKSNATLGTLGSLWVTSNVGIGTGPGGTPLAIQGNFYASNSISTGTVNATLANVSTTNVSSILNQIGIGTGSSPNTALYVQGSISVSKSITDVSSNAMVGSLTNIFSLVSVSNVGIGTTPGVSTLTVQGNVYISNGLTTPQVSTGTWNSSGVSNVTTVVVISNLGLTVPGNVFISNGLTTGSLFSATLKVPTLNVTTINGPLGINTAATSSSTLSVAGNVFASNSVTTNNFSVSVPNITSYNITSFVSTSLGTIQGNAYVSNGIQTTGLIATTANTTTMNLLSILNQNVSVGTLTTSGTSLYVAGNLSASTNIGTLNVQTNLTNVSSILIVNSFVTGANTLGLAGNAYASNGIQTTSLIGTRANITTLNVLSINSNVGIGTTNPPPLYVPGNLYSMQFETNNVISTNANVSGTLTVGILITNSNVGSANTTLFINGNANATTSFTTTNVSATRANITTLNVLSISNLNSLSVSGNVYGTSVGTTNVSVTSANVSRVSNILSLSVTSNIGIGTPPNGNALSIRGDLYASNALTVPSINATAAQGTTSNVTNISQVSGTTLNFAGNAYVSNAVTTGNVLATTVSVPGQATTSFINSTYLAINFPNPWVYFPLQSSLADTSGAGNILNIAAGTYVQGPGPGSTYSLAGNFTFNLSKNLYVDPGITVSLWFLPTPTVVNIFSASPGSLTIAVNAGFYTLGYNPNGTYYNASSSIAPVFGSWTHLCGTIVNGFMTLYVNGVSSATTSFVPNGTYLIQGNLISGGTDVRLYSQALSSSQVQILYQTGGLSTPSTVQIYGNVYTSNTNFSIGNLVSVNANVTTLNVSSISFIGTPGTSLSVSGNVYVSNSVNVANLIVGTVNTPTLNAGSLTMSVLTASSLGFSVSNILVSNSVTTGNLTANGTITYGENITMRSPHLLPTPSNAAAIQAWISGTCNAASKPTMSWWDTSPAPIFSSVAFSSSLYTGCVLLPGGQVLFVSSSSGYVGFFNPFTGSTSRVIPDGSSLDNYFGGVLVPSGNVVFIPTSGFIGIYNPISNRLSRGATVSSSTAGGTLDQNGNVVMVGSQIGTYNPRIDVYSSLNINFDGNFQGAVLTPNGNIVCIPYTNSNIAEFQPATSAVSNTVKVGTSGVGKFSGGVLAPNGNIICVPYASNVGIYNPSNSKFSNVATGSSGFSGGCLLPNGNVVFVPKTASNVGLFDPIALVYSNSTGVNGLSFAGGCLIPDGRVIFAPYSTTYVGVLDTMTPVSQEFCLSPYFNKF